MLIEFRVRNFRSFRDEQIFSFVAAKDDTLLESNTIISGVKAAPLLLRAATLYGSNASGKSNLIKALQYMRGVVAESGSNMQPGQVFNVQPFKLDLQSSVQPTEFEITFILEGVRYQYGFSLNALRIIHESLLVYKTSKPQEWFTRRYDAKTDQDSYEFSVSLKGQKSVWESATRPNSLFLSMAVQLNSEQLKPIFDWFVNKLVVFNDLAPLSPQFSLSKLQEPAEKQRVCDFLNTADISITDISIVSRKVSGQTVHLDLVGGKTEIRNGEQEVNELLFHHVTENAKATFGLKDESMGTQRLLFLAGPVLDVIKKGHILIIDELDNSLHPKLVQWLVKLFQTPSLNTKGAQLIFSTHDASLLDAGLLRRDQIWLVEKNNEQVSKLYSLSEFSPRKNEALGRGYLIGRYGGLPFLGDWSEEKDGTKK